MSDSTWQTRTVVESILKRLGYEVQSPANLAGRSGVPHELIRAHRRKDEMVVLDVEDADRPAELSVLALRAKALDIDLESPVLVTKAPVTNEAEHLAEEYGIRILPFRTKDELERLLEGLLSRPA